MLKRGPGELAQHKLSLLHQHHAMLPSLLILSCYNLQISEKDEEQLNLSLVFHNIHCWVKSWIRQHVKQISVRGRVH